MRDTRPRPPDGVTALRPWPCRSRGRRPTR
jgi:hypothetical protein